MVYRLLFSVAVRSKSIHFERMKKYLVVILGLSLFKACSPPDEYSPAPAVIPVENQKGMLENNTSAPPRADSNQIQPSAPQSTSGLAKFLAGKQINLKVSNNAVKLAPKFETNGTWVNAVDPKQRGAYTAKEDGRVILNMPDKSKLILFFDSDSVKADDEVSVMVDDTLILSTVESVKQD